ncbi:cytoplasmic dynein 2 light intermediate chain 1 [Leptidea sinapis]|uniref:cytoplasmic dynein 2 light intermediate chain 1 n=1 Tax=Leptidea sinapis TaxID=189913 RepID=UPI0021353827|nr:cytoplasmic dynein 2 light intermediate chain 1 [Leptidea sinapis]
MSIPELAVELLKKSIKEAKCNSTVTNIIITGNKNVGKSSLINAFLEKNDKPRETKVLEYSFGRKSSQKSGIEKCICHVWEYSGKLEMLKDVLTPIPINDNFYICVMIDLSKVKCIWNIIETCLQIITEKYQSTVYEIIIIGGKYDIFKNYDSEIKKHVCTMIRSIALLYNAHVIFHSTKEPPLLRRSKEVFYSMGFGKGITLKDRNINFTKPLIIPKGSDTWENIGIPVSNLDQIKNRYIARVTPEVDLQNNNSAIARNRTHPEPILDALSNLKYDELRNIACFDPAISEYLAGLNCIGHVKMH